MVIIALALAVQSVAEWRPGPNDTHQSVFDADAVRSARRIRGDVTAGKSERFSSRNVSRQNAGRWRIVSNAEMRQRSGYYAPPGYAFLRSARADMDRDGKPDLVEMVTNGRQSALRVTYQAPGKPARLLNVTTSPWVSEALVAAGPHAVMVNQPEVNVYFVFQRGDEARVRFIGD